MALVIALFFMVILTVLVLSLLSKATLSQQISAGSVGQARSDFLARSASDIILGELREEIANSANSYIYSSDGSDVTSNPDSGSAPFIYEPKTAQNMVPAKAGSPAADWPTLSKRSYATSSADASLFPGGRSLAAYGASAAASKQSLNGRSVDDTNWRLPSLLVSGTTPVDNNWCILTRSGVQSVADANITSLRDQTSDNYAIGRFSYIVYDTGGALDLNVAGYPTTVTGTSLQGSMVGADLTVAGLSANQAASLLAFRNPASGASPGTFLTGVTQATDLGYLQALAGDNAFLSRQDLINFATLNGFSALLPSLTHFSREINAPSWGPRNNASVWGGSGYTYNDNRNTAGSVNRFIPNVRLPGTPNSTPYTITSYTNNGSPFTYTLNPGDPLVQRRFPLGRLQWLSPLTGAVNGGTKANIQACFGLVWNSSNPSDPHWDYVGPSGSTVQTSIETLPQIAAEPTKREPNFFELLQAGILQGSLGQTPATNPILAATSGGPYDPAASAALRSQWQVFQIGANLIDQQSISGYPTRINFDGAEVYGTKNIPYISKFLLSAYGPLVTTAGVNSCTVKTWLEFEVWNPYQGTATADQPNQFRIEMKQGTGQVQIKLSTGTVYNTTPPLSGDSWITVNSSTLSQLTQDPRLIDTLRQNGAAVNTNDNADDLYANNSTGAYYTGFYCGQYKLNANDLMYPNNIRFNFSVYPTFALELNENGNWVTVQNLPIQDPLNSYATTYYGSSLTTPNTASRLNTFGNVDPRSSRFGYGFLLSKNQFAGLNPYYTLYNRTVQWLQANGVSDVIYETFNSALGNSFVPQGAGQVPFYANRYADNQGNGASTTPYFLDQDKVQRRGDATWSSVDPMLPYAAGLGQRPVILNRPFQTVAEMGYAFRDEPFHSVDFFSTRSGDGALLDLFTVADANTPASRAGVINLNSPALSALNLQSLLQGTTMNPQNATLTATAAQVAAVGLTNYSAATPLVSPGDLPPALASLATSPYDTMQIKGERESVLRGIGSAGQSRTWNLLIDIIAQAGRYPPTASSLAQFAVEGERRYWLHVAIDRFTGKVVSQQLEPVTN